MVNILKQSYEIMDRDDLDCWKILRKIETIFRISFKSEQTMIAKYKAYVEQGDRIHADDMYISACNIISDLFNRFNRVYHRILFDKEHVIRDAETLQFLDKRLHEFHLGGFEHVSITFKFTINRGVSHELVRHRLASYNQESTRFCNYSLEKFGHMLNMIDRDWHVDNKEMHDAASLIWNNVIDVIQIGYNDLTALGIGAQLARGILPNDLKTEIYVTANLRELFEVIMQQRTSKAAHPDMRDVMCPLFHELRQIIPLVFDYKIIRTLEVIDEHVT